MSDLYIFGTQSITQQKTLIDISSATITLDSTSLVYDGTEKTKTVVSVVLNGNTLTEYTDYVVTDNTGINAGSYTISVVGIGDYTGAATTSWSIAKATGSVSVSPTSLTIIGAGLTKKSTVTVVGDGVISVSSSNSNKATATINGYEVTVTSVASGTATITVTMADGDNYTGASATISVTVETIGALYQCTPAQIQQVAQAGTASTYWAIGDSTAYINISAFWNMASTSARAYIIGFDHNSSIEGSGIHFQFGQIASNKYVAFGDTGYALSKSSGSWFNMNNSLFPTNAYGWLSCRCRTACQAFANAIPVAWSDVIKNAIKYTNNSSQSNSTASAGVTSTTDKMFLLAAKEVFGGSPSSINTYELGKQAQYAFYVNGNTKLKYHCSNSTSACMQWLRSPRTRSGYYAYITSSGSYSGAYASYARAIAPAFVIA